MSSSFSGLKEGVKSGELKELPSVALFGGYTMYYITARNEVLCPTCATKRIDEVIDYSVYWEGTPMACDDCNASIESAYGDPEAEE